MFIGKTKKSTERPGAMLWFSVVGLKAKPGAAILGRLGLAFILALMGGLAPAPRSVHAAGCTTSGPISGAYTITVCITSPSDGVTVTGVQPVSATVSITGSLPSGGLQWLAFFLDGQNLLIDYVTPYSFSLPSDRFVDGDHLLSVEARTRDGFISQRASINLTFDNGVTQPPLNTNTFTPASGNPPPAGQPFVVMAAGDGASGEATAKNVTDLIVDSNPNLFLYLGDVYEKGTPTEFYNWYGTTETNTYYGRFREITNPAIGNHEYDGGAAGYFDYWDNIPHYYSYNVAGWHFISLDSTSQFNQLVPDKPQYDWLVGELTDNTAVCTLVYFHHPRYSVGPQGDTDYMNAIWELLAQHGVDIVLTGHDHSYQRWVPLDGAGAPDPWGMTQFVVGTGGHGVQNFVRTDPRMVIGFGQGLAAFGALRLELNQYSADYQFVNIQGSVADSGSVACNGAPPDVTPPSTPGNLSATSNSSAEVNLTWNASTDNVAVTAYEIYRNGTLLTDNSSTPNYTDTNVSAGTTYQYQARARDASGNLSGFSNTVTVTTQIGLFSDDFESNSMSRWVSVTNMSVQGQEVFDGNFAARGITNGTPAVAYKQMSVPQNQLYYRIHFKLINQPQTTNLLKFRTATDSSILGVFVDHLGTLGFRNDALNTPDATTFGSTPAANVSRGVWHELQVRLLINGTQGEVEFWLDGNRVAELSKTAAFGTTPIGRIQLGEKNAGVAFDIAYDNVAVDTQFISTGTTPNPTNTSTNTPTATATPSQTQTSTPTATQTPTATHTATPATSSTTLTFTTIADTYVQSDLPTSNFGSANQSVTDNSPVRHMLLKFNVTGVGTRAVVNAKLRLYCKNASPFGGEFHRVADTTWSEGSVNWNNAPAADSNTLATLGSVSAENWHEVDVTSLVTGDGIFSLRINSTSNDGAYYSTKEGTAGFAPQLIVTTTGSAPTITPTPTFTATPTSTPASQNTTIFSDGFESGNFSQWTSSPGLVVQSQDVASGSYAAQGTSQAGGGATYARKTLSATQTDLYYRIWFKLISRGANTTVNLMKLRTPANISILSVSINNQGKLSYRNDNAATSFNSQVAVGLGEWHTLEVHARIADTNSQVEIWYDGALVSSKTESLGTNPVGILQLGENTAGLTYNVVYDDVESYVSNVAPTATPTATQTLTPAPTTASALTFAPAADTYVQSDLPTSNFGSSDRFVADNSPIRNTLLKFNVSGIGVRNIVSAKLRIYCNDPSPFGGAFYRVSNNTWSEGTVNWNNAPAADATSLATLGAVAAGNWYEVDVTSLVSGDGTFSLKLSSTSTDGAYYSSKEGTNAPQLLIETSP
jgi:hypothetical protein